MKNFKILTQAVALAVLSAAHYNLSATTHMDINSAIIPTADIRLSVEVYSNINNEESYSSKKYLLTDIVVPDNMGIMEYLDNEIIHNPSADQKFNMKEIIIESITGKNDYPFFDQFSINDQLTLKKVMIDIDNNEVSIFFTLDDNKIEDLDLTEKNPKDNFLNTDQSNQRKAFKIEYNTNCSKLTRAVKNITSIDFYIHEALYETKTGMILMSKEDDMITRLDREDAWMEYLDNRMDDIQEQVDLIKENVNEALKALLGENWAETQLTECEDLEESDDTFETRSVMFNGGKHKGKRHGTKRRKISSCHTCKPHNAP